jgi:hypothetical protein
MILNSNENLSSPYQTKITPSMVLTPQFLLEGLKSRDTIFEEESIQAGDSPIEPTVSCTGDIPLMPLQSPKGPGNRSPNQRISELKMITDRSPKCPKSTPTNT